MLGVIALVVTGVLAIVSTLFGAKWIWARTKLLVLQQKANAIANLVNVVNAAVEDGQVDEDELRHIIEAVDLIL